MAIEIVPDRRMPLSDLIRIARHQESLQISERSLADVAASRVALERLVDAGRIIYSVNTSVGGFVNMLVPLDQAPTLQRNIIRAVASNVGTIMDVATTRATMAARIVSLARGNSAISPTNLDVLVRMLNADIAPCIPEKGSLGASGDLGPLACIAMAACGEWRCTYKGQVVPSSTALEAEGIAPMQLSYKEGLALVNGTSAMVGVGAILLNEINGLFQRYVEVSALSIEALGGRINSFDPRAHALKPHKGQLAVARRLSALLAGSRMATDDADVSQQLAAEQSTTVRHGAESIEDAYSIRATPHILGPVLDTIRQAERTTFHELNSSNDNPLILADEGEVFHSAHFHGQYVSMAMDYLSIAMTVLCNLADRRTDRLLTEANSNGLPAFLCRENPGLRLGLMGGQFMATSLTAENRSLATPLSTQTLPSTGDFQDVVSLGLVAARRCREILGNTRYVMAFELLCACQAADIRGPALLSRHGRRLLKWTRQTVPYLAEDTTLTDHLENLAARLVEHGS